ncbi:MAG: histidine phosphatase family protein [Nitrospirota bacterium]
MVTTLYLIRHGETEGGEVKRYKGSIDVPLSARGIEQAKKVADFLFEHHKAARLSQQLSYLKEVHNVLVNDKESAATGPYITAVYCSQLSRAAKSAEIIAGPHGLQPIVHPDLRERSFGIWEGMSFAEIKERYPAEFEAWATNPLKYSPINGESTMEVRERVVKALDTILAGHSGENIVIVAHGGVNRIVLCHILGIPLENIFRIEQNFGAVNIIEFWERYPVVKGLNLAPEILGSFHG